MWGLNRMKNIKIKNYIYVLIAVSFVIFFILASLSDLDLSLAKDFFSLVPKVVSIDLILVTIFTKWGWKLKFFKGWLVPFPNLNGSWVGYINSDWINPETEKSIEEIPVLLTVNQSFFHISFTMHTSEMKSHSVSEGFNINNKKQVKQVSYIYTSKPRIVLKERSLSHDGAVVFDIINQDNKKLEGRYWTERKTTGEIKLDFYKKDILEELPSNMNKHPVSK